MSAKYLLSIFIGFMVFAITYIIYNRFSIEQFTTTTSGGNSSTTNTTSTDTSTNTPVNPESAADIVASVQELLDSILTNDASKAFVYSEDKTKIPNIDHLNIYLTSFSDYTSYNTSQKNYIPATSKWYNHILNSEPFTIITSDTLPYTIHPPDGLLLKNKKLQGPRSDQLNVTDYTLDEFTFSFYVKNEDFVFDSTQTIDLFKVFVESPNYINIMIKPHATDTTKVQLVTVFGSESDRYIIPIDKTAFKGTGKPILFTMTYNKNEKPFPKLYIFIGENQYSSGTITIPPNFVLGNSKIQINPNGLWDAKLYAFMYFNNAIVLATHQALSTYFISQESGMSKTVQRLQELSQTQINQVNEIIQSQNITIQDVRKELDKCKVIQSAQKEKEEKAITDKWKIKLDGYKPVSAEDLNKCSLLQLNNVFTSNVSIPSSTSNVVTTTTSITPSTNGNVDNPYAIKLPAELTSVALKKPAIDVILDNYFTK